MGSKNRKKRVSTEESHRGRESATTMCQDNVPYCKMVSDLMDRFNCSERTAKNWIKTGRERALHIDANIDTGDMESSRWGRLHLWDARSRKYRQVANTYLENDKGRARAVMFENVAIRYEKLVAQGSHFFTLPPERDLEEPEVRNMVLGSLRRQYHHFARDELSQLRDDVLTAIAERDQDNAAKPADETSEAEDSDDDSIL